MRRAVKTGRRGNFLPRRGNFLPRRGIFLPRHPVGGNAFNAFTEHPSFIGALIQVYRTPIDFYPPSLCPAHDGGCFFASRPAKALFGAQNCLRNDACQEALHSQWTHRAAGHNGGTWPCGRADYPHHQRTFSHHKPPALSTKAYPTEVKEVNFAYNPYLCRQFVPAHPPA